MIGRDGSYVALNIDMHTGMTGQIRKSAVGRWFLFHINTGPFWIYGIATFLLTYSLIGFWCSNISLRAVWSLPVSLVGATALPSMVHMISRRRWADTYVISAFVVALLVTEYAHDVRNDRSNALPRLAQRAIVVVIAGLISRFDPKKRNGTWTAAPERRDR
jgi:hypothetical protein